MKKNKLKQIWSEGRPVLHGWLSIASPFVAEIMAAQDYDAISIDIQHGAVDYKDVLAMFQAMRASDKVLMARVPWLDPSWISKVLDAGAYGIICPMINTRAQAEQFVRYMRYPPLGERSFGPTRAVYAAGANYPAEANDEILAFAMIETAEAMENLEEIASTPGLNGIYVGPADLSFSLSKGKLMPAFDREEPEVIEAIKRIKDTCHRNGIKAALHCGTAEYAARAIEWGFDMTTVSGDSRLIAAAAAESVGTWRKLTQKATTEAPKAGGY
ncbi:aldolase/citrate lyase family protein [Rhizobium sp. LjRoot30]|uniref:HpcH/HpaI aldolase family protein n=1 Tax=Rhizobium sp. LjRoot30 TaxID=3342320 RepID=UPI003ECC2004